MTLKEMAMVRRCLCEKHKYNCNSCLLSEIDGCYNIGSIADWLTPEREKELMDWYHENVNTYLNNFCKKFPNADREYIVNNICCSEIYGGICECHKDGCVGHWNSLIESE